LTLYNGFATCYRRFRCRWRHWWSTVVKISGPPQTWRATGRNSWWRRIWSSLKKAELIWFKYGLRWWVNGEEHCLFMVMVCPLWTFLNPGMITLTVNMYRASLKHAQPFCAPTQQRSSNSEMFVFGQPPKIPIPKILAWTQQEPVPKWNTIRHRIFGNEVHTSPITPRSFDGFG
jgi:hypothetical protein